ncbi:MAG TPA: sodium:solute symporter family protein [Methylibium sp.]|uniref:sodium:solute symporter family protein n=1 Tax=Methylibium sp. TaxID=2067992 RepID=UPI002DB5FBE5|nr:sodium:solute symporter family protein [Methylibium sp.]HEU4460020.1 sodium:solute symporter family protein [Methylibium sp.]
MNEAQTQSVFTRRLHRVYAGFTLGFVAFVAALAVLEHLGLSRNVIGLLFLLATVALYAVIGIVCRTTDPAEYYVAGRRVPAFYNGMATGADWMSAASFITLAGTLYLSGFGGLAFILGWSGGFCLVALLLAPYLRRFGRFTIPEFLGERYDGNLARGIGAVATVLCSFTYVVAQIYGVGLITSRLTGLAFEIGVFVGLGGVLVCSFLGGMRAVTWTQVAQYIVLILAFLVPVVWLSVKQTGNPLPPLAYGAQLGQITAKEAELIGDAKEREVIAIFAARAAAAEAKLKDVSAAMAADRAAAEQQLAELRSRGAPLNEVQAAARALSALPATEAEARRLYIAQRNAAAERARPLAGMPRHATQYAGDPEGDAQARMEFDDSRRNFLALVFCLMVGTAGLPHILTRFYTTPSVREARQSVAWSLLFIAALYLTAPALAVMVKYEVFNNLVGTPFDQLPAWIGAWARVDPALVSVVDVNQDKVFQLGEMRLGADIVVLAAPEIGGMPYVISGMVAAGALAAALSTADGLLLTITNALSHDLYHRLVDTEAQTSRRVAISKILLLGVALAAAYVAAYRPADIVVLVTAAFSIAASAFFPALVLGIFWKRASKAGAVAGMLAGLGVTLYYMVTREPWLRGLFGIGEPMPLWFGIQPMAAGVFGVPLGFAVIVVGSLLSAPPSAKALALVERLRSPLPPEAG